MRKTFLEFIYDLKPAAEELAALPFADQAKGMLAEMDAMRSGNLTL